MSAIDAGRWEMARLLVDAGADVNRWSKNGFTPLLKVVARNDPLEVVQFLLAAHANPNYRYCSESYMTSLGFASAHGNTDFVRALLAAGADANLTQCDGTSPLTLALNNGHQEVADLLRRAGASAPTGK